MLQRFFAVQGAGPSCKSAVHFRVIGENPLFTCKSAVICAANVRLKGERPQITADLQDEVPVRQLC